MMLAGVPRFTADRADAPREQKVSRRVAEVLVELLRRHVRPVRRAGLRGLLFTHTSIRPVSLDDRLATPAEIECSSS